MSLFFISRPRGGCLVAAAWIAAGATGSPGGAIPGLDQALDPTVTAGTTINIAGPPSTARSCGSAGDAYSIEEVRAFMESHKGPGSVYDTIHVNYPTVANPSVSLAGIGPLLQQPYDSLVMSRVHTPAVTSIDVEHLTLVYPADYFDSPQPVTVRARRLTFNASGRTLVSYFANYDKVQEHQEGVIWQINGHFAINPTREGFGMEENGGLLGGALGKIAMQGLPIIAYDDHNVGESSGAPNGLPRTLENLQMMDRTLMTHFGRVDVVGLSGGTERAYHLMMFFESNVQSVYFGGFAVPLWTRLTVPPFGTDQDTHDDTFLQNFGFADLAVMGLHRGVHTAFTHNAFEGGRSKYGYWEEMVPILAQYTSDFETRGGDLDGDGVSDTGRNLCHEYDLVDLLEWIAWTRAGGGDIPVAQPEGTGLLRIAFASVSGLNYGLQHTSSPASPVWTDTGFRITGNGGNMQFCIPPDTAESGVYRLVIESGGRIFYVDAADPGPDPANTWKDWGGGADLQNMGAAYNATSASYTFDGATSFMEGDAAHESRFDFGRFDAWSLVVYAKANGDGQHTEGIVTKVPAANNMGWVLSWRKHEFGWYEMVRANHNANRAYRRADSGSADLDWHLTVMVMNGPAIDNVAVYEDGGPNLPHAYTAEQTVTASILNNQPLRVGLDPFTGAQAGAYFNGEIGFIEIWDRALTQQDAADRWNGGHPVRGNGFDLLVNGLEATTETAFPLNTVSGQTYRLEYRVDETPPFWTPTGLSLTGNGNLAHLFDPAGYTTQRTYRIVAE